MSRSARRASALALTVALIGAGIAISSPAVAAIPARVLPTGVSLTNAGTLVAPDYTVEVDCSLIPGYATYDYDTQFNYAQLPIPLGTVVSVELTNCSDLYVAAYETSETRATAAYTTLDGPDPGLTFEEGIDWVNGDIVPSAATQFEVLPNTVFGVTSGDLDVSIFTIEAPLAVEVADPQGDIVDELEMLIPDNATADMVVADDPQYYDADDDLELGGVTDCGITDGNHFYAEAEVVIENAGIYSFRLANVEPFSADVDFQQPGRYLQDPFLALYSTFTPANGHLGVVGCNDDADLDEFSDFNITSSGTMISDRFSQYTVELQPGTYTLVLTSYDDESEFNVVTAPAVAADPLTRADEVKGGFSSAALGDDETGTVEVWYVASELAATGPSPASGGMLAAGLALVTLGGLAFASRRLWSRA